MATLEPIEKLARAALDRNHLRLRSLAQGMLQNWKEFFWIPVEWHSATAQWHPATAQWHPKIV